MFLLSSCSYYFLLAAYMQGFCYVATFAARACGVAGFMITVFMCGAIACWMLVVAAILVPLSACFTFDTGDAGIGFLARLRRRLRKDGVLVQTVGMGDAALLAEVVLHEQARAYPRAVFLWHVATVTSVFCALPLAAAIINPVDAWLGAPAFPWWSVFAVAAVRLAALAYLCWSRDWAQPRPQRAPGPGGAQLTRTISDLRVVPCTTVQQHATAREGEKMA